MTARLLYFAFFFCFFISQLQSQDSRPFRSYGTQKVHKRLQADDPEYSTRLKAMEDQIKSYGASGDVRKDSIPIVFHILYVPGQPYPDEAQILAQIEALNRDFETHDVPSEPFVFDKVQQMEDAAIDPGIFFCLASIGGEPNSSIRYVSTKTTAWQDDDAIKSSATEGDDPLDTKHYLNIWVGTLAGYNSGYAQLPLASDATDGIVIDQRLFGTAGTAVFPYTEGKTLTHLVGSYLGLYELWNDDHPCSDDHVDDTPIHNAPNYELGTNYHHVSLCDSTLNIEMVINFMDNTDDAALSMFTQGQKNRMKAVLSSGGSRPNLTSGGIICSSSAPFAPDSRNGERKASLNEGLDKFKLYPNPATNSFKMEITAGHAGAVKFTALNTLGDIIWTINYPLAEGVQVFRQDCSTWTGGVYMVRAVFDNGGTITQKLRLEKP